MRIKRNHLVIGIALAAVVAIIATRIVLQRRNVGGRRQNSPIVKVQRPAIETVTYTLQYTGDVVACQQATIVARISGSLEQVAVALGQRVEAGQLLAVIDSIEAFQQAQQAAAAYFSVNADYLRSQQLFAQTLISQAAFDNTTAQMQSAEAAYRLAKTRLGYARVTAPFAGFVTKRFLDPGAQVIASASSLFTLMDLSQVKVAIDLLERDVPLVKPGARALITADALPDKRYQGRVGRLSQAVDPATRTMRAEILVPNGDRQLKPGMYATVTIMMDEHPRAVTVPSQAVLSDAKGAFVFALDSATARRLPVKPGKEQQGRTEILEGLTGTETLITTGQQFVKDGGSVTVQRDSTSGAGDRGKPSEKRR